MEPASHNRFYPSPYYPVFGSRMVMIGHPGRRECVRNSLFAQAVRRFRRRVVLTGPGPRRLSRRGGVGGMVEQDLVRAVRIPVVLEASLDAGVEVRGRAYPRGDVVRAISLTDFWGGDPG